MDEDQCGCEELLEQEDVKDPSTNPHIQRELETLNEAAASINQSETGLEKARVKLRNERKSAMDQLGVLYQMSDNRKSIDIARPYYELLSLSKQCYSVTKLAASHFQSASESYDRAKKRLSDVELRLAESSTRGGAVQINPQLIDELNSASEELMRTKKYCMNCEREHVSSMRRYSDMQQKLSALHAQHPHSINKARTFYEIKEKLEEKLKVEQQNVRDLELAVLCGKQKYRCALDALENISEQIHAHRAILAHSVCPLPTRTPGVGAETNKSSDEHCSINIEHLKDLADHNADSYCEDERRVLEVCSISSPSRSVLRTTQISVERAAGQQSDVSCAATAADVTFAAAAAADERSVEGAEDSSSALFLYHELSVVSLDKSPQTTDIVRSHYTSHLTFPPDNSLSRTDIRVHGLMKGLYLTKQDKVSDKFSILTRNGQPTGQRQATTEQCQAPTEQRQATTRQRPATEQQGPAACDNKYQCNQLPLLFGLRSAINQPLYPTKQ